MDTDYDYLFKVVVIGDAGVGKTCVVKRYCDGGFSDTGIPTIGVDFSIKTLKIGTKTLKVLINVQRISVMSTRVSQRVVFDPN